MREGGWKCVCVCVCVCVCGWNADWLLNLPDLDTSVWSLLQLATPALLSHRQEFADNWKEINGGSIAEACSISQVGIYLLKGDFKEYKLSLALYRV